MKHDLQSSVLAPYDPTRMNQIAKVICWFAILALGWETLSAQDQLKIDNGVTTVGVDRSKGGAITWISSAEYAKNIVNLADPGRLIQQSYYAGKRLDRTAEGQHSAWSPWPWNPIQGGGVGKGDSSQADGAGSWASVPTATCKDNVIYTETIPKLWDMPNEDAEALMRQWTQFEPDMPNTIVVRCEFVSNRNPRDRWHQADSERGPRSQEIPACYFTRNFSTMKSYLGDGKWHDEAQPAGPPWGRTKPPLNAMAFFEGRGSGIAVYSPCATQHWNFGPHGDGESQVDTAGPCVHVAPLDRVHLGPQSTYRYRYWLVLGDEATIAKQLDVLISKYAGEKAELSTP